MRSGFGDMTDKGRKELVNGYVKELKPYVGEVGAFSWPLWFDAVYPGRTGMSDEELRIELGKILKGLDYSGVRQGFRKKVIEDVLRINRMLGEKRIVDEAPKGAGNMEVKQERDIMTEEKGGLRGFLNIVRNIMNAPLNVALRAPEMVSRAVNREYDGVTYADFLSGEEYISIEAVLEQVRNILRGEDEEGIVPNLNIFMAIHSAT